MTSPRELKEPTGLFVGDYGGYMSIGYDSSKFDAPAELSDLLSADYKGAGRDQRRPDPGRSRVRRAVGLATVQSDGTLDDFQPGIDFFSELQKAGNLLKVDVTTATIASGETPVVFDWDYLNASHTADNKDWKVVVFDGTGYAGYYKPGPSTPTPPHPAAARLWQEFLYQRRGCRTSG